MRMRIPSVFLLLQIQILQITGPFQVRKLKSQAPSCRRRRGFGVCLASQSSCSPLPKKEPTLSPAKRLKGKDEDEELPQDHPSRYRWRQYARKMVQGRLRVYYKFAALTCPATRTMDLTAHLEDGKLSSSIHDRHNHLPPAKPPADASLMQLAKSQIQHGVKL